MTSRQEARNEIRNALNEEVANAWQEHQEDLREAANYQNDLDITSYFEDYHERLALFEDPFDPYEFDPFED